MPAERRPWSHNELLIVFRLYCRTPFGRLHQGNPEIMELARLIGRTPGAVAMKACNFASLDPVQQVRKITALQNVAKADRELWDRFRNNSEEVAEEAEIAWERLQLGKQEDIVLEVHIEETETEKTMLVKTRRVQSFFRNTVLTAYDFRCAITGIANPQLLNASHIIPWSVAKNRRADPTNGICLNALHDRAFDRGLITFDDDFQVVISPSLLCSDQNEFHHQAFMKIAGCRLTLPVRFLPDPQALEYHRKNIFI